MMIHNLLKEYIETNSSPLSSHLKQILETTHSSVDQSHMISGPQIGALLSILIKLSNAKFAVDIGTYVGFSALAIAEALPEDGQVWSFEKNLDYFKIAQKNIGSHPQGHKVKLVLGDALEEIKKITQPIDFSFVDANKRPYKDYYSVLVEKTKKNKLILFDDALWKGQIYLKDTERLKALDEFNQIVQQDKRVENLLIPIRNGIQLIYKI